MACVRSLEPGAAGAPGRIRIRAPPGLPRIASMGNARTASSTQESRPDPLTITVRFVRHRAQEFPKRVVRLWIDFGSGTTCSTDVGGPFGTPGLVTCGEVVTRNKVHMFKGGINVLFNFDLVRRISSSPQMHEALWGARRKRL